MRAATPSGTVTLPRVHRGSAPGSRERPQPRRPAPSPAPLLSIPCSSPFDARRITACSGSSFPSDPPLVAGTRCRGLPGGDSDERAEREGGRREEGFARALLAGCARSSFRDVPSCRRDRRNPPARPVWGAVVGASLPLRARSTLSVLPLRARSSVVTLWRARSVPGSGRGPGRGWAGPDGPARSWARLGPPGPALRAAAHTAASSSEQRWRPASGDGMDAESSRRVAACVRGPRARGLERVLARICVRIRPLSPKHEKDLQEPFLKIMRARSV